MMDDETRKRIEARIEQLKRDAEIALAQYNAAIGELTALLQPEAPQPQKQNSAGD